MSFLAPLALLGLALAVPIILLYMLRLRRREVVISSTFLWSQVVRDSEANTPWQRLRRNLLLILQLIILALMALALARPFITVPTVSRGQIALLLDASASMNATDVPGGGTRFDEAKRRALDLINALGAGDSMTIIRAADVPQVLVPYTGDQNALRAAVNAAQPGVGRADWTAALTLGAARAASADQFSMIVISDGGLGDAATLPAIPGEVRYVPVGTSPDNLAISALATRALGGQPPQLFAQITNYGTRDTEIIFSLRADGALLTSQRYTVPARADLPIVAGTLPDGIRTLEASLTTPAGSTIPDYLSADNNAYAIVSDSGQRRVLLMSEGNIFLEQVFRSMPGVQLVVGDIAAGFPAERYDVVVLDGWLPDVLPVGDLFIVNPPGGTELFTVSGETSATGSIAVLAGDARTNFLDFTSVNILQFKTLSGVGWADELVRAEGGALLLAGEIAGRQVAVLTFNLFESDLPLQITFPILISNLLEWFTPANAISAADGLDVGAALAIRPQPGATTVRVTLPDGGQQALPVDRQVLVFGDTRQRGIYRLDVLQNDTVLQSAPFAVNLFDSGESDITPRAQIALGDTLLGAAQEDELGQLEFWGWLAAGALAVLLIEWVVYHRRMQVPTLMTPGLRRRRA